MAKIENQFIDIPDSTLEKITDYSKKVEALNEKIEKKTKELKNLQAERRKLVSSRLKQRSRICRKLMMFFFKNNIDPAEVKQMLKKLYNM